MCVKCCWCFPVCAQRLGECRLCVSVSVTCILSGFPVIIYFPHTVTGGQTFLIRYAFQNLDYQWCCGWGEWSLASWKLLSFFLFLKKKSLSGLRADYQEGRGNIQAKLIHFKFDFGMSFSHEVRLEFLKSASCFITARHCLLQECLSFTFSCCQRLSINITCCPSLTEMLACLCKETM